jgi:hypothetical protein
MINTKEILPLIYFQDLLESDKSQNLRDEFISDFVNNSGYTNLDIDKSKGVIMYFDCYYDEYGNPDGAGEQITHEFHTHFCRKIELEVTKAKSLIHTKIDQLVSQGQTSKELLFFLKNLLLKLQIKAGENYIDYPFVKTAIDTLSSFIELFEVTKTSSFELSFSWDSEYEDLRLESITKLHRLLQTDYKLIDSTVGEFLNAFSNNEVRYGIKWLGIGKNTKTTKYNLFYFINQLQKQNFILDVKKDYNKKIQYVFRDKDGNFLENVRQSKSAYLKGSYTYDEIDDIIRQLL